MSAITPVTALPANGVSPSGMLTSALPQIRLQAVTASGGSRLTLIQKSEGGDWFKVPAERVLSGRKLNESKAVLDLATGDAGEVIISNNFGSTAYHVLEENGGFAGNENGTATAYIAGASAPVTTGDLSASNVTASGALSVGTTATLTGAVTMAAAATVGTTLGVTGALTASAALTVGTTLGVTGAATLSSTLAVTGASTLTGNVTFGGKQIATATANVIADPGTGAAIPVTTSGVCMITTAAAETNTLAIPSFVGQRLALICDVYAVGDRVVTSAQAINQTGNTIMTFGAAGDMIELTAMKVGGALRWRVTANDGCALS
jgi:hypothetical protein